MTLEVPDHVTTHSAPPAQGTTQGTVGQDRWCIVTPAFSSMLERSMEHQGDALTTNGTKNSHMKTQMIKNHPDHLSDIITSFRMDITRTASSALEMQASEGVQIARVPKHSLLNVME